MKQSKEKEKLTAKHEKEKTGVAKDINNVSSNNFLFPT
jgi:hypothetical protein